MFSEPSGHSVFSQKLSNENKQRLYKIQKRPTSLFYHVLLIKQNECTTPKSSTKVIENIVLNQFYTYHFVDNFHRHFEI